MTHHDDTICSRIEFEFEIQVMDLNIDSMVVHMFKVVIVMLIAPTWEGASWR